MNLILDQGNTATKIVLVDRGQAVYSAACSRLTSEELAALIDRYRPECGIIASVAEPDPAWLDLLRRRLRRFLSLNDDPTIRLPITLGYRTPETLGRDRIAAAVGAWTLRPEVPLLIIDAGTAITYDVVLPPGHFVGGNISPGLTTRFRALISERDEVPDLGVTTEEAILSGVVRGIVYEMNGYIETMHTKHPHAAVFLTGGHAPYFDRRLKCRTFASENLVWLGLNRIIEYNEDK